MISNSSNSSNRSFGIVFFIFFSLVSIWPFFYGSDIRVWALILGFTFLILGLLNSKILTPLNSVWIKFGEYLGKFISPIIMMFIFFIIITPIGFILKILGKDILNLKFTDKSSYWLKRTKNIGSMNKQF